MKIIKYLLFLILILIIGSSIYIATKDGDYQLEETRIVAAPQEMIFNEVNEFRNWEEWFAWLQSENNPIITYTEESSGEGAVLSWKSDEVGNGKITTTAARPFSSINQDMEYTIPFGESSSEVYWNFEQTENGTQITWGVQGKHSFMEKLGFLLQTDDFSDIWRTRMQQSLDDLERITNEKMAEYSINVDGVTQHGGGYYMYSTTASKLSQVNDRMSTMITDISSYMEKNNIEKLGNPFVLYNEWNNGNTTAIFSAGYFTPSEIITPEESPVLTGFMSNQKVVKTTLKGSYDNLPEAWDRAHAYIQENNLVPLEESDSFEVYNIRPQDTKNPANWITTIYIPIQEP
ncbi:SRPBCC family protein [Autumnicola psychrophila]|uniref:GyrI-like domain-containing protein n=1 Tax=Autumnicola psychrophila TaxID=3075592 RepID=A0ABU3DUY8_9FLAO|nr:GyrI-like domain-containing protein [Zunongwangia sp. F225]MDT0686907.1 GyrI-like domain-containing protein [Zunongwangia sp. F225]